MEVALTFGSLGDIIAVCQLCVQLSRALGLGCKAAGGSAKEYRELRRELGLFVQILLQVVMTYQEREYSADVNGLDNVTRSVVGECAGLVEEALEHFGTRYHDSLQEGGSGNKLRDAFKKIEYSFREKERVHELREKLREGTEKLTLLNGLAVQKSARVDNATMLARIDEVQRLVSAEANSQEEILRLLKEQSTMTSAQGVELRAVKEQLGAQSRSNLEMLVFLMQSLAALNEIKDALSYLARLIVSFQALAMASIGLRFLDPTKELPAVIEDALGRRLTLPAEWIQCLEWNTLHSLLENKFKGGKGHGMVCRRQYALEEVITGKDLDWGRPLTLCLRRGMRVNMSMKFTVPLWSRACPRCRRNSEAPKGATIRCPTEGCGMSFRVEMAPAERAAKPAVDKESPRETLPDKNTMGTNVEAIPDEPSDFIRVRIQSESRFQSLEVYKTFLRAEVRPLLRPLIEQFVNSIFDELESKIAKRVEVEFEKIKKRMLSMYSQPVMFVENITQHELLPYEPTSDGLFDKSVLDVASLDDLHPDWYLDANLELE